MITPIDKALLDPSLLGASLGDPTSWSTWLTVLKSAFGISLNCAERRVFASIAGSRRPPARKVEELWCVCGRGAGKSRMAAATLCYIGCFMPHNLSPGEVGFVLCLAGSKDQAKRVYDFALEFLRRSPILRKLIESDHGL